MPIFTIRHFSVRRRMAFLAAYFAVVIGTLLALLMYEHASYLEDHQMSMGMTESEIQLLNLRRDEKDFIARLKPEYLQKFETRSEALSDKIEQWFSVLEQAGFQSPKMRLLQRAMLTYRLNFLEYVEYRKQLGIYKNEGLSDELNQLSAQMIDTMPANGKELRASLIRMQSLHQLFLYDPQDDLIHEFERLATEIQPVMPAGHRQMFQSYREIFQNVVRISSLIGYSENEGTHYLLRKAAHEMEQHFQALSVLVSDFTAFRYIQRVSIILCCSALLILVSALVLRRVGHSISFPLRQLKTDVELLRQGRRDLIFEFESDEIGKVFASLREFQNDLAQLDDMREKDRAHQLDLLEEKKKLEEALEALKEAQSQLVQSEKLASLGSLVAGVAHEINTPLGIALTMGTTFSDHLRDFFRQMQSGQLRRTYVEEFQRDAEEGLQVMQTALHRAAHLIQSFKQVAVDQASEERRVFSLQQTVQGILQTLHHMTKRRAIEIQVMIPDNIFLDSYPGPFGQVISNLVNNTLLHAFTEDQSGTITISAIQEDQRVLLSFSDNGAGIPEKHLSRIFEPFFTTKLGQGGSGLGLNIVYNIVTGILGGEITVESEPGEGACFHLILPVTVPEKGAVHER